MADNYPYCIVPGKLKSFFTKIQDVGTPESGVTRKWLATIGYNSSNDRSIIRVLRTIDFVDSSNKPTPTWSKFRSKAQAPAVLASAIKTGYSGLYNIYPDAHQRSDQELKDFFSQHTTTSGRVVGLMVSAFRNLVDMASFGNGSSTSITDVVSRSESNDNANPVTGYSQTTPSRTQSLGMAVNINIQLTLPETTDESVYDKLFASLKKHFAVECP